MKHIINRILTRTQREADDDRTKQIGLEIYEEFKDLYLGKEPNIKDLVVYYDTNILGKLLIEDNVKTAIQFQSMLEIYQHYIDDKFAK